MPIETLEVKPLTEVEATTATTAVVPATAVVSKEVRIESIKDAEGMMKTIITTTEDNKVSTKVFEGTEAEVKAELHDFRK